LDDRMTRCGLPLPSHNYIIQQRGLFRFLLLAYI
jgi:hypothetical protein